MMPEEFLNGRVKLFRGDCLDVLPTLEPNSIDAVCCDPPYHLTSIVKRFGGENAAPCKVGKTGAYARSSRGFMNQTWDGGDVAFNPLTWELVFRVLKPGAHLLAFSGTRTYHRMACAIEDAGFEIRDQIGWCYGSGFPKSHDVSKGIDKLLGAERDIVGANPNHRSISGVNYEGIYAGGNTGAECITAPATDEAREWQGWGTALKPAWEPIVLARKPLSEKSVAANVLKHGTGAINIDGCRVGTGDDVPGHGPRPDMRGNNYGRSIKTLPDCIHKWKNREGVCVTCGALVKNAQGRFPANLIHDGSEEVLEGFPESAVSGSAKAGRPASRKSGDHVAYSHGSSAPEDTVYHNDSGSAARFFASFPYTEKDHETQKHLSTRSGVAEGSSFSDHLGQRDEEAGSGSEAETVFQGDGAGRLASDCVGDGVSPTDILGGQVCLSETRRFFYTAKADSHDRIGSRHPTVKPLDLIQYLVRLVTPKGGVALDPFAGTGTLGEAAFREGCRAVLIEREPEYQADIVKRMGLVLAGPDERRAASVKQIPPDDLPMFSNQERAG